MDNIYIYTNTYRHPPKKYKRDSLLREVRSICPWTHHSTGKNSPCRAGRRNGRHAAATVATVATVAAVAAAEPKALCTTGAEAAVASTASVSATSSGHSFDVMGEREWSTGPYDSMDWFEHLNRFFHGFDHQISGVAVNCPIIQVYE